MINVRKKSFPAKAYHAHTGKGQLFIDAANLFAVKRPKPESDCFSRGIEAIAKPRISKGAVW